MKQRTTMTLLGFALAANALATSAQTLLYRNDFSDPSKQLIALNQATYVVTNGQLVLTSTRASAMDTNNLVTSTGGVEPPPSIFLGVLPDQQTREFRIDLISANQDDAFAGIEAGFNGKAYYFVKDQNEIGLVKGWGWSDGVTFKFASFFWTNVPVKNQNITLVLALTRRGNDLEIATRVLDKDNANAVLFDYTVTDTPQSDPVLPNRAVKGMRTELDPVGLPWALQSFGYPVVNIAWFNPQSAPNPLAQVACDNLEVWQYASPLPPGTRFVNINNPKPASAYTSWSTAATNIQDAVDAALPGDQVVVNDGLYATGGRAVGTNLLANRVAVDKPITLRSVNGPQFTVIQGFRVPGTTNGDGAIRCVYLANGASLSGFTLTNGATRSAGDWARERSGGGLWCESAAAFASNCVIAGNSAQFGGGAYAGTLNECTLTGNAALGDGGNPVQGGKGGGASSAMLNNCTLTGNTAEAGGGGAAWGTLSNCTLAANSAWYGGGTYLNTLNNCSLTDNWSEHGGGAREATLNNCTLAGNSAQRGGGATMSILNNCMLTGNSAGLAGGGVGGCTLNNCTLTGNSAPNGGGAAGIPGLFFPVSASALNNCIVYFNSATNGANYDETGAFVDYSCTTPMPTNGVGNITNAPLFVDYAGGNLRLQSNSPCINAGRNAYDLIGYAPGPADLDGNPRTVNRTVDIGAYEYQGPGSLISYAWLQRYDLPTDGSGDTTDADRDGMSNWQEWRCQTDPTNALSVLRLLSASSDGTNVTVSWQSIAGVTYLLERSMELSASPPFLPLASGLEGQPGTTSFTDTNAAFLTPLFYRVGVP